MQSLSIRKALTVVVLGEAGPEALVLLADRDLGRGHVRVALQAVCWKREENTILIVEALDQHCPI